VIRFFWDIPAAGYRWVRALSAEDPSQRAQLALVGASQDMGDRPEPNPALFRVFAQTPPKKEAILAFANRYGNLGRSSKVRPVEGRESGLDEAVLGNFLITWQHQINDMARLVGLIDLIQEDNRTGLARYIRWKEDETDGPVVYFDSHPETTEGAAPALGHTRIRDVIASRQTHHEWLAKFKIGDTVTPALVYVRDHMDLALHHVADDISTGMEWDSRNNRPQLCIDCPALLGAVWLQLADAVANNRIFGQCRQCGGWFEISREAARSNRRYCSDRCRIKAYRARQDKARQMFTLGRTFQEIAVALDSDSKTVQRWITGLKD
jgi:hypothetical protein